jgi:hypothetical protein
MALKAGAEVIKAENVISTDIDNYNAIGFSSGVYRDILHESLSETINKLPDQNDKNASYKVKLLKRYI